MPANSDPIYSRRGQIQAVGISAANTSSQGGGTIGTDIFKAFEADATNGSFVREVRFTLGETTIGTASTAGVMRVFISSVTSGSTTTSNTHLWQEAAVPLQTPSATAAGAPVCIPLNFMLPAGYTILVTSSVAPAANTQWKATVIGGDY
jgi:hypothetical protein